MTEPAIMAVRLPAELLDTSELMVVGITVVVWVCVRGCVKLIDERRTVMVDVPITVTYDDVMYDVVRPRFAEVGGMIYVEGVDGAGDDEEVGGGDDDTDGVEEGEEIDC